MSRLSRPSNDTEANRAWSASPVHNGTDWGWGQGDGVCAMAAGKVVQVATLSDYGVVVKIDHGALIAASTMTRYCHLAAGSVLVKVGDTVKRGQDIARMGNTGSLIPVVGGARAKHLHSELWLDGKRVDEQPYQKEVISMTNRTVGDTDAKRRTTPTIAAGNVVAGSELSAGLSYEIDGYRTDLDPTKLIGGTNKWFDVNGVYSHASTFTDSSTTGLTNLDPVTPPPIVEPPATTAATIADVTRIVAESEKRQLAELAEVEKRITAAVGKPVTLATGEAVKIAQAVDTLDKTAGH